MELRSEATAEIAAARAKEDRLRVLESARAESEARAAAYAADNEMLRLQVCCECHRNLTGYRRWLQLHSRGFEVSMPCDKSLSKKGHVCYRC